MSDEEDDSQPSKSGLSKNMVPIVGVVAVVVIGFIAYSYFGEEAIKQEEVRVAETKNEAKKQESDNIKKAEAAQAKALEEKEKREALLREKERLLAAERETQRLKTEAEAAAQAADREEAANKRKADFERLRLQAAVRKLIQIKNLLEADLKKFEVELNRIDGEIAKKQEIIDGTPKRVQDVNAAAEKSRRENNAAKNQISYNEKKIEEVNLQLKEYQKNTKSSQELIANSNKKLEGLRKEITNFQNAITKAETDQSAAQSEMQQIEVELNRSKQWIKDYLARRSNLERMMKEKVTELEQLRRDPDYNELAKLGGELDIQKIITHTKELLAKGPPTGSDPSTPKKTPDRTPESPVTADSKPGEGGVTVATKKEKITVYTLKDGKTVSATKAIDAGDMLSVKTLEGKFQSIHKEDIVKEESKEQ